VTTGRDLGVEMLQQLCVHVALDGLRAADECRVALLDVRPRHHDDLATRVELRTAGAPRHLEHLDHVVLLKLLQLRRVLGRVHEHDQVRRQVDALREPTRRAEHGEGALAEELLDVGAVGHLEPGGVEADAALHVLAQLRVAQPRTHLVQSLPPRRAARLQQRASQLLGQRRRSEPGVLARVAEDQRRAACMWRCLGVN